MRDYNLLALAPFLNSEMCKIGDNQNYNITKFNSFVISFCSHANGARSLSVGALLDHNKRNSQFTLFITDGRTCLVHNRWKGWLVIREAKKASIVSSRVPCLAFRRACLLVSLVLSYCDFNLAFARFLSCCLLFCLAVCYRAWGNCFCSRELRHGSTRWFLQLRVVRHATAIEKQLA